eukprot:3500189-Alexandrium_andersonii.AAC.1
MSASLVGSEMCIRDRPMTYLLIRGAAAPLTRASPGFMGAETRDCNRPVSYTHLTLPTICSV